MIGEKRFLRSLKFATYLSSGADALVRAEPPGSALVGHGPRDRPTSRTYLTNFKDRTNRSNPIGHKAYLPIGHSAYIRAIL
jgi:hypothetical protein